MIHRIFTYGTLKRGHSRHELLWDCPFLGEAISEPEFQMVSMGPFPALIDGDQQIKGEVYEVSDEVLGYLDLVEGHPHFYRRSEHEVWLDKDLSVGAWVYCLVDHSLAGPTIEDWPLGNP